MKEQNKITLAGTFVKSLTYNRKGSATKSHIDTDIEIGVAINFDDDINTEYAVAFECTLSNELWDLKTVFVAVFKTSDSIDAEFIESDFVKVNSPAIAFPYLRSFITTLTTNSGVHPFILPAYNFTE